MEASKREKRGLLGDSKGLLDDTIVIVTKSGKCRFERSSPCTLEIVGIYIPRAQIPRHHKSLAAVRTTA